MSNELATTLSGDLPMIFELAKQLVPTGMLPSHIKQPGQAVAIILAGRELGMEPMRALRSLQMVQGKVIESADSQLGRFKAAGGRAVFEVLSDTDAKLRLTHPNGDEHTETFTIQQAKAAGLASKDIWQKYPKAMLRSRVITAGLKSVGWDGAVGQYDPEEAEEIGGKRAPIAVVEAQPTVQMPRRLSEAQKVVATEVAAAERAAMMPSKATMAEAIEPELPMPPEPALPIQPAGRTFNEHMAIVSGQQPEPDDDIEELLQASIDLAKKDEPISQPQLARLFVIAKEYGHDEAAVKSWLKQAHGLASRKDITQSKYDAICRRLADSAPLES
jgi:hypothetical protein